MKCGAPSHHSHAINTDALMVDRDVNIEDSWIPELKCFITIRLD